MNKILWIKLAILCLVISNSEAQHRISGYIKDVKTGESLIGANIWQPATSKGTAANTYGFYSLNIPGDTATIKVSYVGYQSQELFIKLNKDTTLHFQLSLSDVLSEEVVVKGNRPNLELTKMSSMKIPAQQIKNIPALLGEVDVLKAIQLMPGVQGGTEGSSGIYVRGGGPDQNLILLDGVPVYNASHLFGFFSVFNADAINNVEVVKGGFPARYGGRLSSVIDINMKEGNMQNWQAEGGIGIISSRLSVEGPIRKNKGSIIVSGRRTYIDILARPLIKANTDGDANLGYYFYDLNAKANYIFGDKDRVYISAYTGTDKFYAKDDYSYSYDNNTDEYKDEAGIQWGNITTALRWNHLFSNRLFLNTTATYSKYNFRLFQDSYSKYTSGDGTISENSYYAAYNSGIQDYGTRFDFDYYLSNQHAIKFGVNYIYHIFQPEAFNVEGDFGDEFEMPNSDLIYGNEYAAYVEDEFEPISKLKINAGLHASAFYVNQKWYPSLQPRISTRYLINENLSVKASYAEMAQFLHLLTNSGIGLPTDLWVPATDNIKPQLSQQTAVGISSLLGKGKYEASIEGYYKNMENLIEYKEGSNFLDLSESWESKVTTGNGWSYGSEFLLRKNEGKFNGWIGYTLSWNYRQFDELNFGKAFPYKYDRRHDISIVANYKFSERFEMSGTWVYGTGNAITVPIARFPVLDTNDNNQYEDDYYYYSEDEVYQYSDRNAYRMPSYHRADLGLTWHKPKKWGEASWSISVYNLYNRQNPFYIDTYTNENGEKNFTQISLFQIIPSISYSFKIYPNEK
ncbi:TonB-dependent receptor [Marivirga sp. S37H4]|uniref:TonB-dependent receptor n=1 Tax=Marivirga aurantiaca TaxID=2802615 RepID=A0A934WWR5_9BACT|nr:TonB-dependent receptor [Marivirga aurantiaca]MBK6264245.1 TonB-dependent receptor [Marivirga aurantiaca]